MNFRIILTLITTAIVQFLCSFPIIKRRKNLIALFVQFLISLLAIPIIYYATPNNTIYFSIIICEIEFLLFHILSFFIIALLRIIAFYTLVFITHKSKIIKKIVSKFVNIKKTYNRASKIYNITFGPNIKFGNPSMVNRTYKKTNVKFNRRGFPIFKSYYTICLPIKYWHKTREEHFSYANRKLYKKTLTSSKLKKLFTKAEINDLKNGDTPDRYTWHHHENHGKLLLVSRKIHSATPHPGGYSVWGKFV